MPGGGQIVGGCPERVLVEIGKCDGSAGLCECLGWRLAHPGARSGDEGDLPFEGVCRVRGRRVHDGSTITLIASRSFIAR